MSSNLTLLFQYEGNPITMQCKNDEILSDVYRRFCSKVGKDPKICKFYFNSKEVPPCNKKLENLGLKNLFTFNVVLTDVIGA